MNFEIADYMLTDLLSTAGATIGIIIAGGILLGNFAAKYATVSNRYERLADEYRGHRCSDLRRGNLQTELSCYRRQVFYLNSATLILCTGLLCFVITVVDAGLSIVFPKMLVFRTIGTCGLFLGLLLLSVAVVLQVAEILVERQVMRKEVADFDNQLPSETEAMSR